MLASVYVYYNRELLSASLQKVEPVLSSLGSLMGYSTEPSLNKCEDIAKKELRSLIESKNDGTFKLIDVRESGEFARGSIPGAVNIPLSTFDKALNLDGKAMKQRFGISLNTDDHIVVFCHSGRRAASVVRMLENKGFTWYLPNQPTFVQETSHCVAFVTIEVAIPTGHLALSKVGEARFLHELSSFKRLYHDIHEATDSACGGS